MEQAIIEETAGEDTVEETPLYGRRYPRPEQQKVRRARTNALGLPEMHRSDGTPLTKTTLEHRRAVRRAHNRVASASRKRNR